jgi:cytochrome c oxidase assembly factor CtaG
MASWAHGGAPDGPGGTAASQAPIWLAQALFMLAWGLYTVGAVRRRPRAARRITFHATMLIAGIALFGPLDGLASGSTAWHMVQHMLLIVVVAPLAVLARPLPQWRAAVGPLADAGWRRLQWLARRPVACALLHATAIWLWHAPAPYMAAVTQPAWHVIEHASFLFTGWLFWWSVLHPGRDGVLRATLALLFTVMHTGLLGALLSFSAAPLYALESATLWDQQLAGLLMWIPGGLVYLGAAVWTGSRWLERAEDTAAPAARPVPAGRSTMPGDATTMPGRER